MTARLTVCGLGPGGRGQVTDGTREAIAAAGAVFLRTSRHPTADLVPPGTESFDRFYEEAAAVDEVYRRTADALVAAATERDGVVYVVPGSPLVLERSVRFLRRDPRVEVELVPSLSFLDEVWARLGVDPVDDGVRLIDGHRFAVEAAGERGPLLVAHAHAPWVLSDIKLALEASDVGQDVVIVQRLGTDDEHVAEVPWHELDRAVEPDHLTSLYLPEVAAPVASELVATVELMHRLRQQCPWDREQDHRSLRTYLIEEAYEVLEAIDRLPEGAGVAVDPAAPLPPGPVEIDLDDGAVGYGHLQEELGDLWMQILFHTELATEAGRFTLADVARGLHDKLVARHPHVFGEVEVTTAEELRANWERIKNQEKQRSSPLDGIPPGLPALSLAAKTFSRLTRAGLEVEPGRPRADDAPPDETTVGRHLLAVVAEAHRAGVDPEQALRSATAALSDRHRRGELTDRWVAG